jgi:hypothetical protein
MSTLQQEATTSAADLDGLPFDAETGADAAEYARIMQRIGIDGDEAVTRVCAFNSSI